MNIMNKALNFAIAELLGDADDANKEAQKYLAVTTDQVQQQQNRYSEKRIARPCITRRKAIRK